MKLKSSRSVITSSQQNGIFLLVGIIVIILCSIALNTYYFNKTPQLANSIVDTILQKKLDSIKLLKSKEDKKYKDTIYPFNPNFLKAGKAYRLGLSADEFTRLEKFRKEGKWINSVEDFKTVTKVNNEKLRDISIYFKFPEWVVKREKSKQNTPTKQKISYADKIDLNLATKEDLMKVDGIGEALSIRIIRYRDKINGFRSDIQLKDVYGLKADVISNITDQFTVKTNLDYQLIDINQASIIDLAEIPYFDYELAREIYQFIRINEGITNFEELSKIQHFPTYKIDRIKLYLAINK